MNEQPFDELDREWKEKARDLKRPNIPAEIKKGFAESVEKRISQTRPDVPFPVLEAAALIFLLAAAILWGVVGRPVAQAVKAGVEAPAMEETAGSYAAPVETAEAAEAAPYALREDELAEEIEILRELGVWDDAEDEALNLVTGDQLMGEMDYGLSIAAPGPAMT